MPLIADFHTHLYPCFDLAKAFTSAKKDLQVLLPQNNIHSLAYILTLTERHDCHFFCALKEKSVTIPNWQIKSLKEPEVIVLVGPQGEELYLFAGRQIVTKERLELLALTVDLDIPDGLPFTEVHQKVNEANGIAVLNWAPGKWMFRRKEIVSNIISSAKPGELLICDTSLRPPLWPTPSLMARAKEKGLGLIAGSDPLPLVGEEFLIGTYGTYSKENINFERPVESLRQILKDKSNAFEFVGKRSGTAKVMKRIFQHMNNSSSANV